MKYEIVICFIIYAAVMVGVSLYFMTKANKAVKFLMAGRALGYLTMTANTIAPAIGAGMTIGEMGLAYKYGWGGFVYGLGNGLGLIIMALLFAGLRKFKFMTMGEEIACYYGGHRGFYHFINVVILLSRPGWIAVQILGGGLILSVISGFSVTTCIISVAVLVSVMTITGGYLSVVYTDVIQTYIKLTGFILLAYVCLHHVGGYGRLRTLVPADYMSFLGVKAMGWKSVVAIPMVMILCNIPDACFRHRIYSSSSVNVARWSFIITGVFCFIFSTLVVIMGMSTFVFNPGIAGREQALPWLATNFLSPWLGGVLLVAIMASIVSCAESDGQVCGVFYLRHIHPLITGSFPHRPLLVSRLAMLGMYAAASMLVLGFQNIVDLVANFLSIPFSGLAVVVILGKYWKRATWQGAMAAILLGAAVSLLIIYVPVLKAYFERPILPATVAALIGQVAVSLMTQAPKPSFEEVAAAMAVERKEIDS